MNKIKFIIGATVFAVIALALVAYAQGPQPPGSMGMQGFAHPKGGRPAGLGFGPKFWQDANISEELQLSEKQVAALESIDLATMEEKISLRAKIEKANLRLEQLLKADSIDRDGIIKQADVITTLQGEMFMNSLNTALDIREILDEGQIEKLESMRPECGPRSNHHKGGNFPDRPPWGQPSPNAE